MEFAVDLDVYLDGLRASARALSTRSVIPVLSGFLITARDRSVELCASDSELTIRVEVPADVITPGAVVLPGRILFELIRRVPPGTIHTVADQQTHAARVTSDSGECLLHGLPPNQFPHRPQEDDVLRFSLDLVLLRRLFEQTVFAVAEDESKPWLSGVHLSGRKGSITALATNGAVIAVSQSALSSQAAGSFSVIVPGRSVQELIRAAGDARAGEGVLTIGHSHLEWEVANITISTRLLDGQYPDITRLLPESYTSRITMNRLKFLQACERAALLAPAGGILLDGRPDVLRIQAKSPEVGNITERVEASLIGDPFQIAMNSRYIMDGLRTVDETSVVLEYVGARRPARIRGLSNPHSYFVVLPLISF